MLDSSDSDKCIIQSAVGPWEQTAHGRLHITNASLRDTDETRRTCSTPAVRPSGHGPDWPWCPCDIYAWIYSCVIHAAEYKYPVCVQCACVSVWGGFCISTLAELPFYPSMWYFCFKYSSMPLTESGYFSYTVWQNKARGGTRCPNQTISDLMLCAAFQTGWNHPTLHSSWFYLSSESQLLIPAKGKEPWT